MSLSDRIQAENINLKKILVMIGTRPECIKLAPLVMELRNRPEAFEVFVCLTSQHREMLQQALDWFPIDVDFDLDLMTSDQHQVELQARILTGVKSVIDKTQPDIIVVQGDTTTAMASAMAGCFHHVTVAHVEAGLRTFNRYAPWPEEINRQLISQLAEIHLAPTQRNADQLNKEQVAGTVAVVGNTVIDALMLVRKKIADSKPIQHDITTQLNQSGFHDLDKPFVLVTGHRRESFGDGMQNICDALQQLAEQHQELNFVYAVHLNPQVKTVVHQRLSSYSNIVLLPPLEYGPFIYLMDRCEFILSDSGGIQEEAPSLNKPVLVMRETTERLEAVHAGAVKLVGTHVKTIVDAANNLLLKQMEYNDMVAASNPFGDGKASQHIANLLQTTELPSQS